MTEIFHYHTNWKEGKVNQMWIQQVTPEWQECDHKYVAIAFNPEKNTSMVMSNPRSHYDTLQWVRRFCGSFSLLYWLWTTTQLGLKFFLLLVLVFFFSWLRLVCYQLPTQNLKHSVQQKEDKSCKLLDMLVPAFILQNDEKLSHLRWNFWWTLHDLVWEIQGKDCG